MLAFTAVIFFEFIIIWSWAIYQDLKKRKRKGYVRASKRNDILCESYENDALTLDDITGAYIGDMELKGIQEYDIVDFDNPYATAHKIHIDHMDKQVIIQFVDNPVYKKRMLRQ